PPEAASDERNWTTPDDASVSAYEASKTLAERAAWDFVAEHPTMALTSINPGAVFGPTMDGRYGSSLQVVERVMSGKEPFAPPLSLPMVDVRDVATLHVAAIDLEAAKGERFAAAENTLSFLEAARILSAWDPNLKTAKREAPVWLLRLLSHVMPDVKAIVGGMGRNLSVSGAKAERVFGFEYIPTREALIASAESIRRYQS
ncbi:MAG: NAD-dependent epimerase/dehydratase family protein, partial [Pseudomonadota bacterium]